MLKSYLWPVVTILDSTAAHNFATTFREPIDVHALLLMEKHLVLTSALVSTCI